MEIGPGRGALTASLIPRFDRVIAVEIDPVLVQYLTAKFRDEGKFQVVLGDVLKIDLAQWGPLAIAGNLPYYITSPIVERVLSLGPLLSCAVFMVQKEVAARITASAGSRDYGFLSVQCQILAEPELLFSVPAAAFSPPPKVESAVVRLTPRVAPLVDDAAGFLRFASLCFAHKRKTLRNNLLGRYGKECLAAAPEGGKRAEQLPIAALIALYRQLEAC